MIPAESYYFYFNNTVLLLTVLTALIYAQGSDRRGFSLGFNAFMIWAVGLTFILVVGLRPIDGVFVDMTTYALSFSLTAASGSDFYSDPGFNYLTKLCAEVTSVEMYFLICCALYIVPLIVGLRHLHKEWAFAVFLAFLGALAFFSYAANGIRNGIATSLVVAAFAFYDRKIAMALLMALAVSIHKSVLLPIVAFLAAGFYANPSVYTVIWMACFLLAAAAGQMTTDMLGRLTAAAGEIRLAGYASDAGMGGDKGGFRLDFVAYSILPILISYSLAPLANKRDPFYRRILCTYLLANAFWLLVMYASQSNRFAYLSWFLMPWVIIYPLVPKPAQVGARQQGQTMSQENLALLAAAITAHFMFTYFMSIVYAGISRTL